MSMNNESVLQNQIPVNVIGQLLETNDDLTRAAIRLTLKNNGDKAVKAVGVRINVYDSEGKRIDNTIKCWYKNLYVEQGFVFGENRRIPVKRNARSFECEIGAVVLNDGSVIQAEDKLSNKLFNENIDKIVPPKQEQQIISESRVEEQEKMPELTPEDIERLNAEKAEKARRLKALLIKIGIIAGAVILAAVLAIVTIKVIVPEVRYNNAVKMMESGEYLEASEAFADMNGYKDSASMIIECLKLKKDTDYQEALDMMKNGKYSDAIDLFSSLDGYSDSKDKISECEEAIREERYQEALSDMSAGKYEEAKSILSTIPEYKDSTDNINECDYNIASQKFKDKDYDVAIELFESLNSYKDSADRANEANYQKALILYNEKKYDDSNLIFEKLGNYKDSAEKIHIHEYQDEVSLEPTCTETGIRTYKCSCGQTYDEDIPALGHSYDKVIKEVPPTCTAAGSITYTCRCGLTETKSTPATGHTHVAALTQEPSCEAPGILTYTCHCGDSYTEAVPAKGHDYTEATCTKPAKCKTCGKVNGSALGHTTKQGNCYRCHKYIRDGEVWDSYDEWYEATQEDYDYWEDEDYDWYY